MVLFLLDVFSVLGNSAASSRPLQWNIYPLGLVYTIGQVIPELWKTVAVIACHNTPSSEIYDFSY